jgi:hypothetical protein
MKNDVTYSAEQLVEKLASRPGVKKITAEPDRKYSVDAGFTGTTGTGPAVILVVTYPLAHIGI